MGQEKIEYWEKNKCPVHQYTTTLASNYCIIGISAPLMII